MAERAAWDFIGNEGRGLELSVVNPVGVFGAVLGPDAKQILPELGKIKNATNEKAKRLLGPAPRSNEQSIVATAESLLRLGLLKRPA